ncbi:DUF488 domain-containing protein [Allokutzneria sp. A3M-2-11 16]|uniref:DUF488 domain-containing protein n=1 Tax=Allokutzneria sp. A3M-2-11 16 TaxID=2962043 RepID=UPI0020B69BA0|nr:DUF488 domain-containing protein [Allokutzneria sp. A3M-2-11 16]MCP3803346.1 DUF488 domain-containing protein [Allokutzneria sp. A3M-2-11 16]
MRRIATIGVYGFTAGAFVETLIGAGVGLLLDLRQRRGVRGPDYSWANSVRLQHALAAANIGYRHVRELAPTTELRQLQYREDDRQGVGKRNRVALAPEYAERYTHEILDPFDLGALVAELPSSATAFLCVERDPEACHRSLVAARVHADHGVPVTDLRSVAPLPFSGRPGVIASVGNPP